MAYTWKRRGDAWQIGRERLTNSVGYIRPRAADQFVDIVLVSFAPTDRFVLLPATHAMPFETVFRTSSPLDTSVIVLSTGTVYLLDSRSGIGTINIIVCSCFEKIIDLIIILFASVHGGITSSSHSTSLDINTSLRSVLISHFQFHFYSGYVYATSSAIIITWERYPTFEPTVLSYFPLYASKREHFHTIHITFLHSQYITKKKH